MSTYPEGTWAECDDYIMYKTADGWCKIDIRYDNAYPDSEFKGITPLVLLNPQNQSDLVRLKSLVNMFVTADTKYALDHALRAYAAGIGQKVVEEPQGLGAVVRCDLGRLWVRTELYGTYVWGETDGLRDKWGEFPVSTKKQILSEGVTVE